MGCNQSIHDSHNPYYDKTHLMEPILANKVRLLDPDYLTTWFENRRADDPPLPGFQELPEQAFLKLGQLSPAQKQKLKIITISYCWLSAEHPDPNSYHVETVVKLLESFRRSSYENTHGSYGYVDEWHGGDKADWCEAGYCFGAGNNEPVGIFWDWCSIPATLSSIASENSSLWTTHRETIVWMLSYMPPNQPKLAGEKHVRAGHAPSDRQSGWAFYERHSAAFCTRPGDFLNITKEVRDVLCGEATRSKGGVKKAISSGGVSHTLKAKEIKTKKRSNHLKKAVAKKANAKKSQNEHQLHKTEELERHQKHDVHKHDYSHAGSYLQLVFDTMDAHREMPLPPEQFNKELERKTFYSDTEKAKAIIKSNYGETFAALVANATHLDFGGLCFDEHESRHLLELLSNHCKMSVLQTVDLNTNEITFSLAELGKALTKHRLKTLDLHGNTHITGRLEDLRTAKNHINSLNITHTKAGGDLKTLQDWKQIHELFCVGTNINGDLSHLKNPSFTILSLSDTKISGSFRELESYLHLKVLLLDDTNCSGSLSDLVSLQHLEVLHLSGSNVEGVLKDAMRISNLTDLVLHETNVCGKLKDISTHVSSNHELKKLEHLDISGSKGIEGDIAELAKDVHTKHRSFTMPLKIVNFSRTSIVNINQNTIKDIFPGLDLKFSHI